MEAAVLGPPLLLKPFGHYTTDGFIRRLLRRLPIWKILVGYHKRSNVEAAFSRLKRILGHDLRGRKKSSQQVEIFVKCMILNRMAKIGMPNSYPIENVN